MGSLFLNAVVSLLHYLITVQRNLLPKVGLYVYFVRAKDHVGMDIELAHLSLPILGGNEQ